MTRNRILADKHRIALAGWPVHQSHSGAHLKDNRRNTIDELVKNVKEAGYDAIE